MTTQERAKESPGEVAFRDITDILKNKSHGQIGDFPAEDTLGGRIQKARAARGLSTAQLARRLGILSKTIQNWEADRSEPRANKLQMLAGVLSVPLLWLLDGEGTDFDLDVEVNVAETASLESKVERLLELHQQSAKLIFELQSEVRRLQGEIDEGAQQAIAYPDTGVAD